MRFQEYQTLSARTLDPKTNLAIEPNYILGLYGEIGELIELIKAYSYSGDELDAPWRKKPEFSLRDMIAIEIGDICWYVSAICTALNIEINNPFAKQGHGCAEIKMTTRFLGRLAANTDIAVENYYNFPNLTNGDIVEQHCIDILGQLKKMADFFNITFHHILFVNIKKLKIRHPVAFSQETSRIRADNM
jgi:NTP pyrophosphatase (non-canonical NTP hydrolase)